ncbi:hypothetical protein [Nocardia harenae]|nr:hypothetical protein [Nocardia harenae]
MVEDDVARLPAAGLNANTGVELYQRALAGIVPYPRRFRGRPR